MKILDIKKIDKYNYELSDDYEKYNLNIQFYTSFNTDDLRSIYIHENLLKNNNVLSFGNLEDTCGKVIKSKDDEDLIILFLKDGTKMIMKRLYG